jgi:ATP-dependent Zn protease
MSALDDKGVSVTEPSKSRTAYHEAAHAVVAELLGVRVDVVSVRAAEHFRDVTITHL